MSPIPPSARNHAVPTHRPFTARCQAAGVDGDDPVQISGNAGARAIAGVLASLTPAQVATLSADVAAIGPDAFLGLAPSAVQALSGEQVLAVTTAQLAALRARQIEAFGRSQLSAVTPAQLTALHG